MSRRENDFSVEPSPSSSTPALASQAHTALERPRRHTITRPESALALLPDLVAEDEQDDDEMRLDRISDILSNLIQEASEAIQDNAQLHIKRRSTLIRSRLPRLKRRVGVAHTRVDSISSSSSTSSSASSFFAPPSPSSTATSISRSPSPTTCKQPSRSDASPRPHSCSSLSDARQRSFTLRATPKRLMPPALTKSPTSMISDPLIESFKRLDSSLALVESLSRDLATTKPTLLPPTPFSRLAMLLLFPLLHIPHALITMLFGISDLRPASTTSFSSLAGLIVWTCFFAIANLVVDRVAMPVRWVSAKTVRRLSLPGSYVCSHTLLEASEHGRSHALHDQPINNHALTIESQAEAQRPQFTRRNSI